MKIVFVCAPPGLHGGQRVIATYADLLAERGHEVIVAAGRARAQTWRDRARRLVRGGKRPTVFETTHFARLKRAELRLLDHDGPVRAADIPDADVVVATWWETAFAVAALPAAKGRKFYFIQHHEVHPHLPAHITAGSYHLPLKKLVIAGWLKDAMRDLYGDPDAVLTPNGVDLDLFDAPPRGRRPAPTVGIMYAPVPFKGLDVALDAIGRLRRRRPDLQVVAFGKRPPIPRCPLPPATRYFQNPAQEEIRGIYASCDLFLSASRSEGFGLPILEAMACRCPVVSTRTGCGPDVIRDGENGWLADIDDADGLAAGMERILDLSDADWRRMSEAARVQASSFTWDDATRLFEAALREG